MPSQQTQQHLAQLNAAAPIRFGKRTAWVALWLCVVAWAGQTHAAPAAERGLSAQSAIQQLGHKDAWVRWEAAYVLGLQGPQATAALPDLERILADPAEEEYVRGQAAWAIGRMRPNSARSLPLLIRVLTSKHVSVRRNAAQAIGELGPAARTASSDLEPLLDDEDPSVRASAAVAIWKMGRDARALATLEEMLRTGEGNGAYWAARALGEFGPEAAKALADALAHPDQDVRRAAAFALGRIGPPALPALRRALDHRDATVRCQAVEALGWIGPGALGPLTAALSDPEPLVRRAAVRAIGRLGPAAQQAAPRLLEALRDHDADVRSAAAEALKPIGTRNQ